MGTVRPEPGLQFAPNIDVNDACRELEALGWRVIVLPRGMSDRKSFFDGIRSAAPLDPQLVGDRVWDALDDSLWGGLLDLEEKNVAMFWPDAGVMEKSAPADFAIARDILSKLPESLSNPQLTLGNPKQVAVVLT